jgi:hypothetical protein
MVRAVAHLVGEALPGSARCKPNENQSGVAEAPIEPVDVDHALSSGVRLRAREFAVPEGLAGGSRVPAQVHLLAAGRSVAPQAVSPRKVRFAGPRPCYLAEGGPHRTVTGVPGLSGW